MHRFLSPLTPLRLLRPRRYCLFEMKAWLFTPRCPHRTLSPRTMKLQSRPLHLSIRTHLMLQAMPLGGRREILRGRAKPKTCKWFVHDIDIFVSVVDMHFINFVPILFEIPVQRQRQMYYDTWLQMINAYFASQHAVNINIELNEIFIIDRLKGAECGFEFRLLSSIFTPRFNTATHATTHSATVIWGSDRRHYNVPLASHKNTCKKVGAVSNVSIYTIVLRSSSKSPNVVLRVLSQVFVTSWVFQYYISLQILLTIACVGRHALDIPDQHDNVLHSVVRRNEIAKAVNAECLIPSVPAVIKLANVLCVRTISTTSVTAGDK